MNNYFYLKLLLIACFQSSLLCAMDNVQLNGTEQRIQAYELFVQSVQPFIDHGAHPQLLNRLRQQCDAFFAELQGNAFDQAYLRQWFRLGFLSNELRDLRRRIAHQLRLGNY